VARIILQLGLLSVVMIGLGLLVTNVLVHYWPLTLEAPLERALAATRTPAWDRISNLVSLLGYVPGLAFTIFVGMAAMRIGYHRWREAIFLAAAFLSQLLVFLATSRTIVRARPPVPQLDAFQPMQSFPSGHVAAAVAVYGGVAMVLALHARDRATAVLWWALFMTIPVAVAISRVYRGEHNPSDVVASFIVGFGCLWILRRGILQASNSEDRAGHEVPVGVSDHQSSLRR
jgi:membrane-associated phospholipid phosphatase